MKEKVLPEVSSFRNWGFPCWNEAYSIRRFFLTPNSLKPLLVYGLLSDLQPYLSSRIIDQGCSELPKPSEGRKLNVITLLTLISKKNKYTNTFLIALTLTLLYPHVSHAAQAPSISGPVVFPTTSEAVLGAETKQKLATAEELKLTESKTYLADLLEQYLEEKSSPMAKCAPTIVTLKNWKKIVARSAAESAFGKRSYNYNAWGVMSFNDGKATLKKMGNNWCEASVEMNTFFDNFPRNSKLKYAEMTIEQECGIYKQPCEVKFGKNRHHWINNNYAVMNDMDELEAKSIELAEAHIKSLENKELAIAK